MSRRGGAWSPAPHAEPRRHLERDRQACRGERHLALRPRAPRRPRPDDVQPLQAPRGGRAPPGRAPDGRPLPPRKPLPAAGLLRLARYGPSTPVLPLRAALGRSVVGFVRELRWGAASRAGRVGGRVALATGLRARAAGASARCAASFFGTKPVSWRAALAGRHTTSSLPMIWTGAQPSAAHNSPIIRVRASRSSPRTLILINWCVSSARLASAITAPLRPASPIITTGSRWCASALRARRCAELSAGGAGGGVDAFVSSASAVLRGGRAERDVFIEDPAIMDICILLAP